MKNILKVALIILGLFLYGCVSNPFSKFYHDGIVNDSSNMLAIRLMPYSGTTHIYMSNDQNNDANDLIQKGYAMIGASNFEGSIKVTQEQLLTHGKKVGADIILYTTIYQGSHQSAVPLVQYNPGQTSSTYTYGTVNASAYGPSGNAYGTASYTENSTTTTPGTYNTNFVPVTMHRYQYGASFWRKIKPPALGVQANVIPLEMRKKLNRNTGAYVERVINDSPAFRANILPGDVIIKINNIDIMSYTHLVQITPTLSGMSCDIKILRNGKEFVVPVQM